MAGRLPDLSVNMVVPLDFDAVDENAMENIATPLRSMYVHVPSVMSVPAVAMSDAVVVSVVAVSYLKSVEPAV